MSHSSAESDEIDNRRKRIRQACLSCRRKKIRCDGHKPVCNCCQRTSQTCIYALDGRRARSSSFPYAISESALESMAGQMSAKFTTLEARLARIENAYTTQGTLTISSLDSTTPNPNTLPLTSHTSASNHLLELPDDVENSMALATSPQETLAGIPYYTLSFAADIYFRFSHNQPYSLFYEPAFRTRLIAGELPMCLVWALLAIARHYSTLPNTDKQSAPDVMTYARRSWDCLKLPWNGGVSEEEAVSVLQTLALLVMVEHTEGHCASAYMKLGFGLRLALHYKLHLEPEAELSPIFREERKRCFWSLFLQDKLMSLARERFCIVRDEECKISLPCSELAFRECRVEVTPTLDRFTSDCMDEKDVQSCCPLALIMVMASVLYRVSQYTLKESGYAEAGAPWASTSPYIAISSTLLQLELHFGMNKTYWQGVEQRCTVNGLVEQHIAGPFIYSKALFHLCQCLLHHPFLLQQRLQRLNQRAPTTFAHSAWQTCRTHAKTLTDLTEMKKHNVLVLTTIYSYCTMVAGTIHVLASSDKDESIRQEHLKHQNTALQFLLELACYWKHAALMANRFERFRQRIEGRDDIIGLHINAMPHTSEDNKLLWQSVDYSSLSSASPPGSPKPYDIAPVPDFFMSPIRLFEVTSEPDNFYNFGLVDNPT